MHRYLAALWLLIALARGETGRPVKVMVVTGGHPYDAAFGSLFEGYPEISAKIYPRDVAFGWDMRAEWDVLVFYDLTQKISEIEKKNLQAFVEGGEGIGGVAPCPGGLR